jgi:hypothetical protein
MLELWRNDALGRTLVERGRKKLEAYSWPAYVKAVAGIVAEASARVRSGRSPRFPEEGVSEHA